MVFQFNSFLALLRRIPRLWRFGLSLILGLGISVFLMTTQANAAQSVLLTNRDATLLVPVSELEAIAHHKEPSEEVTAFFESAGYDLDIISPILTGELPYFREVEVITPREFLLLQVNKTMGDPLRQEDLASLEQAFRVSLSNDGLFSVIELLSNYPAPVVRLDINRMEQVYSDLNLFVTRISPVLSVAEELLPELVCDCNVDAVGGAPTSSEPEAIAPSTSNLSASEVYNNAKHSLSSLLPIAATQVADASPSTEVKTTTSSFTDKELVFTFGPLGRSISISELTTLAETGETSQKLDALLKLGRVNPADLQEALNQPIKVELGFLDHTLNSLLGEFLLFEVGQVIHTRSKTGNIQALRSTLILSTAGDNEFTAIEVLQNYPTSQIYVDGARLARFGRNVKRFESQGGVGTAALSLEDWLVQVQVSAAEEVCTCDNISVLPTPAPISSTQLAEVLPANWQPVPSHREDRGIIKAIWLQGTPYEMGYQHGELLHDEIAEMGTEALSVLRLVGRGFGLSRLSAYRSYPDVSEECRGIADATQDIGMTTDACMVLAYGDVLQELFGYTLPEVLFWDGCSQFVATNNATKDGKLYHGSTLDNNKKPIDYIVNNPVVMVRQPTGGIPHVFFTYPGMVWPNWGLNMAGISMGLDTAHPNSPDELQLQGRSNVQIMANVLGNATTFNEARTLLETEPRVRANLIMLADGRSHQAGVFEFTGKHLAVRELQEDGVLYTTNHFVLEEMYDRQPLPLNQSTQLRFMRYGQLLEPDGASSVYGNIDETTMARVLRDRVNPETMEASPVDVFDDDASPGGNGSLRQAIYEPDSLRFWVAAGPPPVPENPFVCFSLGEMLGFPNSEPCAAPTIP